MKPLMIVLAAVAVLGRPDSADAQSDIHPFELGVQITTASSGEFDQTEIGFGGRFGWRPADLIGVEAEIDGYPGDFPEGHPFSRGRIEALFGVTVGPRVLDRFRPYARLRPGLVKVGEAPQPLACILIFPPPLACVLAAGRTLFALDLGGGVEIAATRNTFVRVDAGDRLLRYPGPALDSRRRARQDDFFAHDVRLAAGAGWRF